MQNAKKFFYPIGFLAKHIYLCYNKLILLIGGEILKRAVCIFLCIVFCFTLSGCSPVIDIIDLIYANDAVREVENKPYFAFSNGTLFKDSEETYLPAAHFDAEQSEYSQYRSSIYYNTLSPEEQELTAHIFLLPKYNTTTKEKNQVLICKMQKNSSIP